MMFSLGFFRLAPPGGGESGSFNQINGIPVPFVHLNQTPSADFVMGYGDILRRARARCEHAIVVLDKPTAGGQQECCSGRFVQPSPLPWPRLERSCRRFEMGPASRNYVSNAADNSRPQRPVGLVGLSVLANQGFLTGFSTGRVLNEGPKLSGQPRRNCPSSRHGKVSLRQIKTSIKERRLLGCPR